jgi:hypothetical protein
LNLLNVFGWKTLIYLRQTQRTIGMKFFYGFTILWRWVSQFHSLNAFAESLMDKKKSSKIPNVNDRPFNEEIFILIFFFVEHCGDANDKSILFSPQENHFNQHQYQPCAFDIKFRIGGVDTQEKSHNSQRILCFIEKIEVNVDITRRPIPTVTSVTRLQLFSNRMTKNLGTGSNVSAGNRG